MVAVDALEQMNAEAFELVAADACGHGAAHGIEVALEEILGQRRASSAARRRHGRTRRRRRAQTRAPNGARACWPRSARSCARAAAGPPAWTKARGRAPGSGRRRARAGPAVRARPRAPWRARAAPPPRLRSRAGVRFDRTLVDRRPAAPRPECRRRPGSRWRTALFDASTSGAAGKPQGHHATGLPAALGQQRHHRGRGLLDRAAGDVDQRPIVARAQPARERDFLGHRLTVDVLIVIAVDLEAEQPVLADLHDALGTGIEPDHQRPGQPFELRRHRHARHQRHVARSSRRDWRDRSRSASSRCARRRPAPRRPLPDPPACCPSSCSMV